MGWFFPCYYQSPFLLQQLPGAWPQTWEAECPCRRYCPPVHTPGVRPEGGSFLPRATWPSRAGPRTQAPCLSPSPDSTLPQGNRSGCELAASWLRCRCWGGFQTLGVFSPPRLLISQHSGALLSGHIGCCEESDSLRPSDPGSGPVRGAPLPQPPEKLRDTWSSSVPWIAFLAHFSA